MGNYAAVKQLSYGGGLSSKSDCSSVNIQTVRTLLNRAKKASAFCSSSKEIIMPQKRLFVAPELVTITTGDLKQLKTDIEKDIDIDIWSSILKNLAYEANYFWTTFFDKLFSVITVVMRTFKGDDNEHRKAAMQTAYWCWTECVTWWPAFSPTQNNSPSVHLSTAIMTTVLRTQIWRACTADGGPNGNARISKGWPAGLNSRDGNRRQAITKRASWQPISFAQTNTNTFAHLKVAQ